MQEFPSVLWHCWLCKRKDVRLIKNSRAIYCEGLSSGAGGGPELR